MHVNFALDLICSKSDTHQAAEANEQKNAQMKAALGIREDYKDGSAFNQEVQATEKAAREKAKLEKEMKKEKQKDEAQTREKEKGKNNKRFVLL